MTVIPSALLPRRRYAAPAIACALALFGIDGKTPAEVEASVAVEARTGFDRRRWRALDRWTGALVRGAFWTHLRAPFSELHR